MKNIQSEDLKIELASRHLSDWKIMDNHLFKTFMLKDFNEALEFMNKCGIESERLNHHPDWRNVYNQVDVKLNTHETAGITTKDLELAEAMDNIFNQIKLV